ncbi:MAG: glycosyltransferase [Bacteroidia bacterium]
MKILYITFDGLTDPLGQSQVLPYLKELASQNYQITIISCEKKEKFSAGKALIESIVAKAGIKWIPVPYSNRIPFISSYLNTVRMRSMAFRTVAQGQFNIVHCRSYLSALIGLKLRKKFGLKFIFDMRGFWADERVDGGIWKKNNPIHRMAYVYFKKKEKHFFSDSDHIISLTEAGKKEITRIMSGSVCAPVTVIPCCADLSLFNAGAVDAKVKATKTRELGIEKGDWVLSYLGSLGTWYKAEEMLSFYKILIRHYPNVKFLILTPDNPEIILTLARKLGLDPARLLIRSAVRSEVPAYLSLSVLSIFFIQPCYSKIASSPTKLAELLGMGIPVITNAGIGDMEEQIEASHAGLVIKSFTNEEYERAIDHIPQLLELDKQELRQAAENCFSLTLGSKRYSTVYQSLCLN